MLTHLPSRRLGPGLSLLVLALIVALVALASTSAGSNLTAALGIRAQREPFTTLSFADPDYVGIHGVTYRARDQRLYDRFAFRIRNQEHHAITYRWAVTVDPATPMRRGRVSIPAGRSTTVRAQVELSCAVNSSAAREHGEAIPRRVRVSVALRPSGDRIDFWRACG